MISVNISAEGAITISSEPLSERAGMSKVYAAEGGGVDTSSESESDERSAAFFKSGWDAAIAESQIRYVSGGTSGLEAFWNELAPQTDGGGAAETPETESSEGYMEPVAVGTPTPTSLPNTGVVVHKVDNSGEPDKEAEESPEEPGIWTISNDELEAREQAAYERGIAVGMERSAAPRGPIQLSAARGSFDWAVSSVDREDSSADKVSEILERFLTNIGIQVFR